MESVVGEIAVVPGDMAAWACSIFVLITITTYVIFEGLKRWRVGLRLAALDESLLNDDGVNVEEIMDVPVGSNIVAGLVAEFVEDGRS